MNNIADDLSNAYGDGLRDGAPKWIKTAERLPTAEDGGDHVAAGRADESSYFSIDYPECPR